MRTLCLSLIVVLAACKADPLAKDKNVAGWANASSALGVMAGVYDPIGFATGDSTFADAACPATSDDGTTAVITGGCRDSDGVEWTGSATVVRGAAGMLTVTFTGYGNDQILGPVRKTGAVVVHELAPDRHSFDVDVTSEGGLTEVVEYSGTVDGAAAGATTWNGSGTISRDGDFFDGGTITATTVNQLRDDSICAGEGISGRTTMTSDDHTVVIDYDGATDCDGNDAAHWSRDGEDQGIIEGISCSAGSGAGGPGGVALIGLALGLARRRRNRACHRA
jgi:MYXO-CTERM domain-containing protein